MGISAKIIKHSVNPAGVEIATLEVVMPRMILAEFNTHCLFARNSASSRAIPVEKMIARAMEDPFVPLYWGRKQKGMQADEELTQEEQEQAKLKWLRGRDRAVQTADQLVACGLHKQVVNRVLEPYLWHTVVVTATEWENFFNQRRDKDAEPHMQLTATAMFEALQASKPIALENGEYHLPYVSQSDYNDVAASLAPTRTTLADISAARCARVSYLQQDGRRDIDQDLDLAARLKGNGHMSPFEHPALARSDRDLGIKFRGYYQYRKMIPGEAVFREGRGPRLKGAGA